jgi:hypothetical protein
LRLGSRTLEQLYAGLKPIGFFAPDISQRFTYFDKRCGAAYSSGVARKSGGIHLRTFGLVNLLRKCRPAAHRA